VSSSPPIGRPRACRCATPEDLTLQTTPRKAEARCIRSDGHSALDVALLTLQIYQLQGGTASPFNALATF
jgi:hypothetical protein